MISPWTIQDGAPPVDSFRLKSVAEWTLVSGSFNELVHGVKLNQLITGGHHPVGISCIFVSLKQTDWMWMILDDDC